MSNARKKIDPIVIILDIAIIVMLFVVIGVGIELYSSMSFDKKNQTFMQEGDMFSFELQRKDYASMIQGKYMNEFNGNTESVSYYALADYIEATSKYKVYVEKGYNDRARTQKNLMNEARERMGDLIIFADRIDSLYKIK